MLFAGRAYSIHAHLVTYVWNVPKPRWPFLSTPSADYVRTTICARIRYKLAQNRVDTFLNLNHIYIYTLYIHIWLTAISEQQHMCICVQYVHLYVVWHVRSSIQQMYMRTLYRFLLSEPLWLNSVSELILNRKHAGRF